MDLDNFLYEAIDASRLIDVKSWGPYFDEIPVDPYIRDGYRYKSIGWFRVKRDSAAAMAAIDEHIATVNGLSGMPSEESLRFLASSPPSWRSAEILSAKTPPANMPMGPVPEVFRS